MVLRYGFTLVELLIALVLSSMIIIGLGTFYNTVIKTKETLMRKSVELSTKEFFTVLFRSLYGVREFKAKKENHILRLSYLTNYGLLRPFVRVNLIFLKGKVIYKELNPYSDVELIYYEIPINCSADIEKNEILILSCGTYEIPFPIVKLSEFFYSPIR